MFRTPFNVNSVNTAVTTMNTELISPRFLSTMLMWILLCFGFLLGFIWLVDPFGVSPLQINIPTFNVYKTERAHIDRLIKPYEVWRYQPKTIFMGTSRIHQSMDPAILNGTQYAPAYNAAIPASTLSENLAHIEQYLKLDQNLQHIFIELFLYNFTKDLTEPPSKTWKEFFSQIISLHFSGGAFLNSIRTVLNNKKKNITAPAHITPGGNWVQSSSFNPASTFSDVMFIRTVLGWDKPAKMKIGQNNFEYLDRILKLAQSRGVQLHIFITPNYPWDDYRLFMLGNWPILEEWLRKVAEYPGVVSFSQYNPLIEEEITNEMQWWNDPTHFSPNMGRNMLNTYLGRKTGEIPDNFMRDVNQNTIESIIAERKAGLLHWVTKHPDFATTFADIETTSDIFNGTLNTQLTSLLLNETTHPIRLGVGEVVFTDKTENSLSADGWAVDEIAKQPVKKIIATIGNTVAAQWFPTAPRSDIEMVLGKHTKRSGFSMTIPLKPEQANEPIRLFAIMRDGHATQLTSASRAIESFPLEDTLGKVQANKIILNGMTYPIVERLAGAIESAHPIYHGYQVNGWTFDMKARAPVIAIIATFNSHVVAKSFPMINREDLNDKIAAGIKPTGFRMIIPINEEKSHHPGKIKLYSLMADNVAVPLATNFTTTKNELFEDIKHAL